MSVDVNNKEILQSNKLIRAAYSLTLNQKRFLMLAIANANKNGASWVDAVEFAELFGVAVKEANRIIKVNRESIRTAGLSIDIVDGKWQEINFFQFIKFDGESYQVLFVNELKSHIANLNKNFTRIDLIDVAKLKSPFSMRLYEKASQYKKVMKFYLTVREIQESYKLPKSYTTNATLLRDRIISPSCKEITKKTNIFIDFKSIKKGRSVERFEFSVYDKLLANESS